MPATPGELLKAALAERGISQSELGRRFKFENPYQTVHRWTLDDGFNEDNQKRVIDELGLDDDYFKKPDAGARREAFRQHVFAEFLRTEIGQSLRRDERKTLESVRFPENITPSVPMYQAWAIALKGKYSPEQLTEAVELNEAIDDELTGRDKRRK